MGTLGYGYDSRLFEFDDRTLAHLRAAIIAKLRRQESFTLSFGRDADPRQGRESLWFHPSIPLRFTFDAADGGGPVNRAWLEALSRSGDTGDMRIGPEPERVPA